jgi:hypothetical protein
MIAWWQILVLVQALRSHVRLVGVEQAHNSRLTTNGAADLCKALVSKMIVAIAARAECVPTPRGRKERLSNDHNTIDNILDIAATDDGRWLARANARIDSIFQGKKDSGDESTSSIVTSHVKIVDTNVEVGEQITETDVRAIWAAYTGSLRHILCIDDLDLGIGE